MHLGISQHDLRDCWDLLWNVRLLVSYFFSREKNLKVGRLQQTSPFVLHVISCCQKRNNWDIRDLICDFPYIRAACWQIYPQSIWCKLAALNLDVTEYLSYQWTIRLAEEHDWLGSASASLGLSVPLADWSMCDPAGSKGQDLNENFK